MSTQHPNRPKKMANALGLPLFILFLPLILVAITCYLLAGLFLHLAIWCCWCLRGRYVLLVYSDSPIWQGYVEEEVLPRLGESAVVLNWSERGRWRQTLAVLAFRYFGGHREFNPLAVVFQPFRIARQFRFYRPFREFKQGRPEAVEKMKRELFDLVDEIIGAQAA
jgi:hypothetical protein